MASDYTFPQIRFHIDRTATSKLRRTETGRQLLDADWVIADRVKYDPDDTDRIWVGVRRTAIEVDKHRTLQCLIDDETWLDLDGAVRSGDPNILAQFALRLHECFKRGINQCPFIQEDPAS